MEFIEWLDAHVLSERRSSRFSLDDRTVTLWEKDKNVEMSKSIGGLPDPFVIVDPFKAGQWRLFKGLDGSGKNCDFLILGKRDETLFAFFVELKSSLPYEEGKIQLRWTRPLLNHLLSVFNVDSCSELLESDLVVKYFLFGDRFYETLDKRTVKTDFEIHSKAIPYQGLTINYRVSDIYSLNQLLQAD